MVHQPMYMTAEGYQKLRKQLEDLQAEKRPTVLQDLQAVSGGADWRDNAEQVLLQDQLARLDAEIRKIETMLADVEVVEPDSNDSIVDIGETVVLETDGTVETYTLVGPTEADPGTGRISYKSPLGNALLKRKVGDEIAISVPAGNIHYRIMAVH